MAARISDGIRRGHEVRIVIEAPGSVREVKAEKATSCFPFVYFVLVACTSYFTEGAILSSSLTIGNSTGLYLLQIGQLALISSVDE
jgi:hypothetical protein